MPDGIVKGLWGYEAGQAGTGDIFGWFVDNCVPSSHVEAAAARGVGVHEYLTELAARQRVGEHGLLALDWHSGNRSILDDTELTGLRKNFYKNHVRLAYVKHAASVRPEPGSNSLFKVRLLSLTFFYT